MTVRIERNKPNDKVEVIIRLMMSLMNVDERVTFQWKGRYGCQMSLLKLEREQWIIELGKKIPRYEYRGGVELAVDRFLQERWTQL